MPNFRQAKIEALEEELRDSGHIDSRPMLTRAEILDKLLHRCADHVRDGRLKVEELVRLVDRFWMITEGGEAQAVTDGG